MLPISGSYSHPASLKDSRCWFPEKDGKADTITIILKIQRFYPPRSIFCKLQRRSSVQYFIQSMEILYTVTFNVLYSDKQQ